MTPEEQKLLFQEYIQMMLQSNAGRQQADSGRPPSNTSSPTSTSTSRPAAATAPSSAPDPNNPHPPNAVFVSPDGLISYDRYGRRLDSLGNVAYPNYGGGGGTAASGSPATAIPAGYGSTAEFARSLFGVTGNTNYTLPNFFDAQGKPQASSLPVPNPVDLGTVDPQRLQFLQNSAQYYNDFNEAQRQFNENLDWKKIADAYAAASRAVLPDSRFNSNY